MSWLEQIFDFVKDQVRKLLAWLATPRGFILVAVLSVGNLIAAYFPTAAFIACLAQLTHAMKDGLEATNAIAWGESFVQHLLGCRWEWKAGEGLIRDCSHGAAVPGSTLMSLFLAFPYSIGDAWTDSNWFGRVLFGITLLYSGWLVGDIFADGVNPPTIVSWLLLTPLVASFVALALLLCLWVVSWFLHVALAGICVLCVIGAKTYLTLKGALGLDDTIAGIRQGRG